MFDIIKTLLTFGWAKGWRTNLIVIFVVGLYLLETVIGIDLPGVNITWEMVLIALGLKTSAVHDSTGIPASNNRG
jgi:hypothetical protein